MPPPAGSAEPIVLPTPAATPRRPPLPIVATIVPVAAAAVLWLVTGSALTLLFAALGPLIAVATMADAARTARRAARAAATEMQIARDRASAEMHRRHADERGAQWAVHPDAGALIQRPADVWRPATERGDGLVIGTGEGLSGLRVVGGGDGADAAELRRSASTLAGVPAVVPLQVGVCVVGPRPLATAVARALVVQLCLVHPPDRMTLASVPPGEDWAQALPHRRSGHSRVRVAFTGPGQVVGAEPDAVVAIAAPGAPVPAQCGAVLTLTGPRSAVLEHGADRRTLTVEGLSRSQAAVVAAELAAKAPAAAAGGPPAVLFSELEGLSAGGGDGSGGLAVAIGRESDAPAVVDLVGDGPHAVVVGVTGSGKSELLITWVASLCAARTPSEVCFLLADFKGGTAFDTLAALPHVTGVLTDLDGTGARRAMESLRAELRRREAELARVGARDIRDEGVALPRLVIVVDEFAAVLADHPELHAVFTDVAARGRALGMHLVLGTQRAGGVIRDALLANCPLRVSLRVTDAADSRSVIGTADAALLPGEATARGLAYVRRAGDAAPRLTRIALTTAADLERIASRTAASEPPRAPWLPALPHRLPLADLRLVPGRIVLGLADEPHRQRQPTVELTPGEDRGLIAVGAARSGRSTLVTLIEEQVSPADVVRIGPDPEAAWDAVAALAHGARRHPVVLADDVDALVGAYPPDYAAAFLERWERIVRSAGASGTTVVMTAQRLSGALARIADLLPQRALLPMPSRIDHVTAGGDPASFDAAAPPGRAMLGGRAVQFALPTGLGSRGGVTGELPVAVWHPRSSITAVVVRGARGRAAELAPVLDGVRVLSLDDHTVGAALEEPMDPPTVIVGDPDGWQRQWTLFSRLRANGEIVVGTTCASDFRALTGRRELPPYSRESSERAWLVAPSGDAVRVRLPGGSGGLGGDG